MQTLRLLRWRTAIVDSARQLCFSRCRLPVGLEICGTADLSGQSPPHFDAKQLVGKDDDDSGENDVCANLRQATAEREVRNLTLEAAAARSYISASHGLRAVQVRTRKYLRARAALVDPCLTVAA